MAVPPLIRMIWGRPKILVHYEIEDMVDCRFLTCHVYNEPILKGFLYWLRVPRDSAEDVRAEFEVLDYNTNKVMCSKITTSIKTQTGVAMERISLPASVLPATFPIVFAPREIGLVGVANDARTHLPIGRYEARIEILFSNILYKKKRSFLVIDKYPFVYWEINS